MTVTRAEVEELLQRLAQTPPNAKPDVATELVQVADAQGDADLRFRARLAYVSSLHHANDRHRMFAPFVYVLQQYDAAPGWMTEEQRWEVLWLHKWMVTWLVDHPQVPLAQLQEVLDGMRRRYAEAGEGLAPVLGCAYVLRAHVDGEAAAEAEFDAWVRAPRTHLSDCEGCEPSARIAHLAELGRHEEVLAELAPVVDGDVGCSEQPQVAIGEALTSLVVVGDHDRAATLHRTAFRASRSNPADTASVARHLHVLARTGNLTRGLEVLGEQRHALEHPSSPYAGMELAAAATRLLHAVVAAGDGDTTVRGGGRAPERAADLLVRVEEQTWSLARAFDERNGTTAVGDRVRAWVEAPDLPHLPLGPVTAPAETVARLDVVRTPLDPTFGADPGGLDLPALAELVILARRRASTPTWTRLVAHWKTRRDGELAALDRADAVAVRAAADLDAFALWAPSPHPDLSLATSAAELYRTLGDEAEAVLVEVLADLHAGRPVDVAAVVAAVDAHGTPVQRARVRSRVAAEALEEQARALHADAYAILVEARPTSAEDRSVAARVLLDVTPFGPDRPAVLQSALDLLDDGDEPMLRAQVASERAVASAQEGDLDAAHAHFDEAARVARVAGAPEVLLQVEARRAHVLAGTGQPDRAEVLALAVAAAAREVERPDLAIEQSTLAAQLMASRGRELEAVEVAEAALGLVYPDAAVSRQHRALRRHLRAQLLDLTSRLSAALGEQDRAVALAREAVDLASGPAEPGAEPDPGAAAVVARLAGLVEDDDAVEATRLYAHALDLAERAGQDAFAQVVRRERVAARFDADGVDAALRDVDDAARSNAAAHARTLADPDAAAAWQGWDFAWEDVVLAGMRSRVLASAGLVDDALAAVEGLPARWDEVGGRVEAIDAEILRGRLLLHTPRPDEGVAALESAALRARAAGETSLVHSAAGTAASWLDESGRPAEAQALWDRLVADV